MAARKAEKLLVRRVTFHDVYSLKHGRTGRRRGRDWKRSTLDARRTRVADAAVQPVSEKYEDIVARLARWWSASREAGLSLEESIAASRRASGSPGREQTKLEEAERKVEVLLEGDRTAPFSTQEK